jgi:MoaA/NifB/PqqE/SkfB family radical SAM enzyme
MKPILKDITVEVTNRCQLHCRACGIWREEKLHEISAPRFVRMMEGLLKAYRVESVSITGGEPFLHHGLSGILRSLALLKARRRITGFGVYTNGACVEAVQALLRREKAALKGMDVGVSVDGGEAVHDLLRGKGAYAKTLRSLEFLAEECSEEVSLELKFTISRINYAQIAHVYALSRRLGARFSPKIMEEGVSSYYHRQGSREIGGLLPLTGRMRMAVRRQLLEMISDGAEGLDVPMVEAVLGLLDGGRDRILACATPQKSLFITSRGDVYPCLYMPAACCVGQDGSVPPQLDLARKALSRLARKGDCPRCFAYHGFLKSYNLRYLRT